MNISSYIKIYLNIFKYTLYQKFLKIFSIFKTVILSELTVMRAKIIIDDKNVKIANLKNIFGI